MKAEIYIFVFLGITLISLAKASIDWSKYTRKVHLSKSHDEEGLKKTAKKVGISSIISGASFGFLGILARDSSSMFARYHIGIFLSILIALMCGLIWASIYLGAFLLKAYTLKSLYKGSEIK